MISIATANIDKVNTKEELLIGKNHVNIKLLIEKNNYLLNKYKNFYDKSENIKELVDVIKNYKY